MHSRLMCTLFTGFHLVRNAPGAPKDPVHPADTKCCCSASSDSSVCEHHVVRNGSWNVLLCLVHRLFRTSSAGEELWALDRDSANFSLKCVTNKKWLITQNSRLASELQTFCKPLDPTLWGSPSGPTSTLSYFVCLMKSYCTASVLSEN